MDGQLTAVQEEGLRRAFSRKNMLSSVEVAGLARLLGIHQHTVTQWFQRKTQEKHSETVTVTDVVEIESEEEKLDISLSDDDGTEPKPAKSDPRKLATEDRKESSTLRKRNITRSINDGGLEKKLFDEKDLISQVMTLNVKLEAAMRSLEEKNSIIKDMENTNVTLQTVKLPNIIQEFTEKLKDKEEENALLTIKKEILQRDYQHMEKLIKIAEDNQVQNKTELVSLKNQVESQREMFRFQMCDVADEIFVLNKALEIMKRDSNIFKELIEKKDNEMAILKSEKAELSGSVRSLLDVQDKLRPLMAKLEKQRKIIERQDTMIQKFDVKRSTKSQEIMNSQTTTQIRRKENTYPSKIDVRTAMSEYIRILNSKLLKKDIGPVDTKFKVFSNGVNKNSDISKFVLSDDDSLMIHKAIDNMDTFIISSNTEAGSRHIINTTRSSTDCEVSNKVLPGNTANTFHSSLDPSPNLDTSDVSQTCSNQETNNRFVQTTSNISSVDGTVFSETSHCKELSSAHSTNMELSTNHSTNLELLRRQSTNIEHCSILSSKLFSLNRDSQSSISADVSPKKVLTAEILQKEEFLQDESGLEPWLKDPLFVPTENSILGEIAPVMPGEENNARK